ncbi:MAG: peptidylprolyl isomerase [Planctomycetota bacterium]|jgi:peptidyl-prolyl cis-trans isomerase C
MKNFLTICACLVVLAGNFAVAAEDQIITMPGDQGKAIEKPNPDSVIVTVNGIKVTEKQVAQAMGPAMRKLAQVPEQLRGMYEMQEKQKTIQSIVTKILVDEEVGKAGVVIGEKDIDAYINEMVAQQGMTLADLKAIIESSGRTFEQWKQQMSQDKRVREGLTYKKFFDSKFEGKVNVTPEDANSFYQQNTEKFKYPEQIKASHILIKPADDPNAKPDDLKAAAKAKAEGLLKQVKSGGDFAALAKANSSCGSAQAGGDLGFFGKGNMVPEFEKAAFALKVGEISDLVETQYGYHIIKVTGHKDAGITTFAEAKDKIITELTNQKQQELLNQYIEQLKEGASIVYAEGKEPAAVPIIEKVQ